MFFERPDSGQRALLLHVPLPSVDAPDADETRQLALGAGLDVREIVRAPRQQPHPRYFVGTGKLDELKLLVRTQDIDLLLLNHDVGAGQQRNLEAALKVRVMPRSELILHIFADRARTHEGQLQVELAQLEHARTRLVRGWTHLDRQKGGIGLRGAGETQIEMDQRMLGQRIKQARRRLQQVEQRRALGRRHRQRQRVRTVSLVGYTNAGKSTLFNALTHAEVLAEDRLFATLDPTMRQLHLGAGVDAVIADTVGFISHLPHTLVAAFKATLEEVAQADLLLHVIDGASPDVVEQVHQVLGVLREIGAHEVPTIAVINKSDQIDAALRKRLALDVAPELAEVEFASAISGEGLTRLGERIRQALAPSARAMQVHLAGGDGANRAWLYEQGVVLSEQIGETDAIVLDIEADSALLSRLQQRLGVGSSDLLQGDQGIPRISLLPN